jgi:hypothetical protein
MKHDFGRALVAVASLVAASSIASQARAQDVSGPVTATTESENVSAPSEFARDRNISVRERPRPDYEAEGVHAGSFFLYPRLTFDVTYDDNIFASPSGFRQSDTIFQTSPELAIKSDWSRHSLSFLAHANFNDYLSHTTEDTVNYGVAAAGRLDVIGRSYLFGGASYDRSTEARTDPSSPQAAARPIQYDLGMANFGGLYELNRVRLQGEVTYSDYRYQNNTTTSGAFLRQDDRDRAVWTENARAEYALSPATSIFVTATTNQRIYRLQPPVAQFDRDSSGYEIDVGSSFDLTHLMRGEIDVGYLSQSYSQPGFQTISGLSYKVLVDWFPTQLTTVDLSASRTVQEPVDITASGFLSSNVGIRVDHELFRNILLSAKAGYGQDLYKGASRTDNRANAGVSVTYLLNRRVGLRLSYDYLQLNSSGTARINNYNDNRILGGVTLQF